MRILVVEDNKRTADLLKQGLVNKGFAIDLFYNFEDGLAAALDPVYDVVLLDRRLPDNKDGLEICRQMREAKSHTPVIILTAQGEVGDKLEGFKYGTDDYLVKPFSVDELNARIQAILRRSNTYTGTKIIVGDLVIDPDQHQVFRSNQEISLTPKEYAVLYSLAQNKGRFISKDYLVSHAWDGDADILPSSIETYISKLRQKIDKAFTDKPKLITTRWGFGYQIKEP